MTRGLSSDSEQEKERELNSRQTQLLSHFDEIPRRVERDSALNDRKVVTIKDYSCSIKPDDLVTTQGGPLPDEEGTNSPPSVSVDTRFIWFDYHKQCSAGAVHNIAALLKPLSRSVADLGTGVADRSNSGGSYAVLNRNRQILSPQTCIIRTNCIDCLDRTNVVQTCVARWVLRAQLKTLGLCNPCRALLSEVEAESEVSGKAPHMALPTAQAEELFRSLWSKNGDAMSLLYAGTPALKRDVTRTGKRTNQGVLDDGFNSAMRYYLNNYRDEQIQKELDFTLGKRTGIMENTCPKKQERGWMQSPETEKP